MFKQLIEYLKIVDKSIFEKEYLAVALVLATNVVALTIISLSCLIVSQFLVNITWDLCVIIWNRLTPGQKLLELSVIVTSLSVLFSFFKAANELEKSIYESFEKLKKQNLEKETKIAMLEDELTKLKNAN
jgi:D-alanyl-lipoteichoic acid acyltransferase DltB (MBOAT superfamily)